MLATLRSGLGSLDRVVRVVKAVGFGSLHQRLRQATGGYQWVQSIVRRLVGQ